MGDYVAGRMCESCGHGSPYSPVCGECEVAHRYESRIDTLLAENAKLRAAVEAAREYRDMEAPGLDMCRDVARDALDAALAALEAP